MQNILTPAPAKAASDETLRKEIARLPASTGLLAFSDMFALHILDAARRSGRAVPRDIAVVGIGNDDLLCLIGHPTLTSVDPASPRIGRVAFAKALQLIRGDKSTPLIQRIEPLGIVERGSTSLSAMVQHPLVRNALQYLDQQPVDELSVEQLLNHLLVSRSTLDRAFRQILHRSVYEEIRLRRLRLAKELLIDTNFTGVEITSRTGFHHLSNLSAAFKAEFGITLSEFRRQNT